MNFTFFMTFVPQLESRVPIVIGYEKCTPKTIKLIHAYEGIQFIHSGNWWNIDPKKRTLDVVLGNQEKLYVPGRTIGFMSLNTPASLTNYEYWNISEDIRKKSIQKCLDNATWAMEHKSSNVPIYCSLEVSTFDEAKYWFQKARHSGHNCFCRGVAEFLANPKLRKRGIQTIFEITIGARLVLEDLPLHLSGLSSLNLLPIVAYLGATSIDGSTPVTSALGRGTVYTSAGKGLKCNDLKDWSCTCDFCQNFEGNLLDEFARNGLARVQHNVAIWQHRLNMITACTDREDLKSYIENDIADTKSKYYHRIWQEALEIEHTLLG